MKRILLLAVLLCVVSSIAAQYTVSGGNGVPVSAIKSGITEVYLLNGLEGAQISFKSSQSGEHQWFRFSKSIDDAESISCVQTDNVSVITVNQDGYGYYVAAPMGTGYIWIVDYKNYIESFTGLAVMEDEYRCERLKLIPVADFTPIYYYINGMRNELLRKFKLTYNNLSWNEEQKMFIPVETVLQLNGLYSEIEVNAPPLTNTIFTLTDVFAEHFGIQQSITSAEYQAIKVEAHATAETFKEHADNEIHHAGDMLGGSAPIEYTFTAYVNKPAALMCVWKVLQIDGITGTQTEVGRDAKETLAHKFDRNGTYRVVLEVNGKNFEIDGKELACVDTLVFDVVIDNTVIKIPNAFSPGSSPGVNDELKIAFTSVVTFKASVFNRWGNLLFQWTDPSKGWDGRVNGKFVPTGVYYVIVEYKDSNGKSRTMSRAVNLLRGNNNQTNIQ